MLPSASKARHRLNRESVSWCLETSLLKIPFPGQDFLPGTKLPPYLLCLFFHLLYFFLPVFEDNDLLFWVPDVLCQHSEVVLWNLLSIEMFFWWICEGETGLPVLFLCHLRNSLCLFFFKRTVTTFKNTNILLDFLWNQFSFQSQRKAGGGPKMVEK